MEKDVLLDLRPEEFINMVKENLISNKNDKKDAENVEVIAKNNSKVQDFLNGNGDDIVIGETEADNSEYNENAYNDIPEENPENPVLHSG